MFELQPKKNQYEWILQSLRMGIYLLIVILSLLVYLIKSPFYNWTLYNEFYLFAIFGIVTHLGAIFWFESYLQNKFWMYSSFVLDVVLISLLMYKTELNSSLFVFMYFVVVFSAGIQLKRNGTFFVVGLISVFFSILSVANPDAKGLSFLFFLILNNVAFYSVAFLSLALQQQLEWQGLSIQNLQKLNEIIINHIPSGLVSLFESGRVIKSNPAAAVILNNNVQEGTNLFDVYSEIQNIFNRFLKENKKDFEIKRVHSDGEDQILRCRWVSPKLESKFYLLMIEDLTEIKKIQEHLQQAEKMAAIGQLAAGIAHEIRNPLAGISGSIELLSQTSTNEDDKRLIKIILREIDRLNFLITEFLDYAKPQKIIEEPLSLDSLLNETLESLRFHSQLRTDVHVEMNLTLGNEFKILGDSNKLKQMLINIFINAYQALADSSHPQLKITTYKKSGFVYVDITDNGCGMKEEFLPKIFEPFRTTKPKGTGLGLAISYKILQAHHAEVEVRSAFGLGTTFILKFPLSV